MLYENLTTEKRVLLWTVWKEMLVWIRKYLNWRHLWVGNFYGIHNALCVKVHWQIVIRKRYKASSSLQNCIGLKTLIRRSETTQYYWMLVERYSNMKEAIGGSIPGCQISSLLDKILARWSTTSCALALACRPSMWKNINIEP